MLVEMIALFAHWHKRYFCPLTKILIDEGIVRRHNQGRLMEGEMKYFKLIGRTVVFETVRQYEYFGIQCIKGRTLDGRYETVARVADVVPVRRAK